MDCYLEAKKKKLEPFWNELDRAWFEKWPEEGLQQGLDLDTPAGVEAFARVGDDVLKKKLVSTRAYTRA